MGSLGDCRYHQEDEFRTSPSRWNMPEVTTESEIPCSAQQLRQFLGQTSNLLITSDPDLDLEILSAPEVIAEGERIEFRISAYGFKQRMEHQYVRVSETEIVAEQIEGPARAWKHTQVVQAGEAPAKCQLVDRIEFEPPGGMLGFVMTEDMIRQSISDGMEFRYEALQQAFDNA